uniref:Uncharacterized protein n=1 Tax=Pseudomonas aeruginosa TaxID=287 RepID=A0A5P9WAT7_PSEAI|nr:hypothetical protein pNK546KPC_0378 [Pseudomonas aeruginosa]
MANGRAVGAPGVVGCRGGEKTLMLLSQLFGGGERTGGTRKYCRLFVPPGGEVFVIIAGCHHEAPV